MHTTPAIVVEIHGRLPTACSAYRIGQRRNVLTYRLVTCGTVEEVMYRLQVFKVVHNLHDMFSIASGELPTSSCAR